MRGGCGSYQGCGDEGCGDEGCEDDRADPGEIGDEKSAINMEDAK